MRIGTAAEVRRLDAAVIKEYGVPQSVLMENAAMAALQVIKKEWGTEGYSVLLFCGSGNNAGDGFALARQLYSEGAAPVVFLASDPTKLTDGAALNFKILQNLPIEIIEKPPHVEEFDVLVDALLGTGLSRPVEGRYREAINWMNASGRPILSLDLPTGVHADTGAILGTAVESSATVSFGIPKRGNLLYPGTGKNGRLYVARISFPPEVYESDELGMAVNVPPALPERNPQGHKGSFGKVLIIGGAETYYGAPFFAASSVLKTGAGYARLACPESMVPHLATRLPEAVYLPMKETRGRRLGTGHLKNLLDEAHIADAVVLGPGMGRDDDTLELAKRFVEEYRGPLVVDGDALLALRMLQGPKHRHQPYIATPHPGEAARLTDHNVKEVEKDRVGTARRLARMYQAVVVLKGARTLIASEKDPVRMNLNGNDGMGTAGSGDILSGILGALLGLGILPEDAARLGVHLHGTAGDIASKSLGRDGMTASDIMDALPQALVEHREKSEKTLWTDVLHLV